MTATKHHVRGGHVPAVVLLAVVAALGGCSSGGGQQAPAAMPPPEVSVMKVAQGPVTVFDEYVGRTEAPDTIEIRARVGGILERQAFQDGAAVKAGDLLYVIDQSTYQAALAQAKATLAQAQANLINSQQNLERQKQLIGKKLASEQDYDAAVASAQANAALVEAQRALLDQAALNLGYTKILAPRAGVMSKSAVKPGSLIKAQDTLLATLYSSDPMYVYFAVSEQRLMDLLDRLERSLNDESEKGLAFGLKLIDGSEYRFPGRLSFVDAAVDENTGTLQMRISVPNPDHFLRPGQFVRVVVPAFETPDAIRVPEKAVQELQGLKSVYVVGADNKPVSRPITARYRVGNDWVVEKGLASGERVVVEGTQKVHPGQPVKPVMLAESGPGSAAPAAAPAGGGQPAAPGSGTGRPGAGAQSKAGG